MEKYYVENIKKLNADIQLLLNQRKPTNFRLPANAQELQELYHTSDEQLELYEKEKAELAPLLERLENTLEESGVVIDRNSRTLRIADQVNPRGCAWENSPLGRLRHLEDAREEMRRYLEGLNRNIPVYPALHQYNQLWSILTGRLETLDREIGILNFGKDGEELVLDFLRNVEFKYILRPSVILPAMTTDSQTSETDIMLLTSKGIFAIEVKNYGRSKCDSLEIHPDGSWVQMKNGKETNRIGEGKRDQTPTQQNRIHAINIEAFLKAHGYQHVPVISLITIARKDITINNQSRTTVLKYSELIDFVESYKEKTSVSRTDLEKIAELFDREGLEARAFKMTVPVCTTEELSDYAGKLHEAYQSQRWLEINIGRLLEKTVDDILAKAPEELQWENFRQAEAERQYQLHQVEKGIRQLLNPTVKGFLIRHLIRLPIAALLFKPVFSALENGSILYRLIHESGYLSPAHAIANASSSQALRFAVILSALMALWLLVWILPEIFLRFRKQRKPALLLRDSISFVIMGLFYFLLLRIMANGVWLVSVVGYGLILLTSLLLIWLKKKKHA